MPNEETLLAEFSHTQDPRRLEELADALPDAAPRPDAARALLGRLGGARVQDDRDVEDAVCGALVRLGIMEQLGNLTFRFVPEDALPAGATEALREYEVTLPRRYFEPA